LAGAHVALDRSVELAADAPEPRFYLGVVKYLRKDLAGAAGQFREVTRLEPANAVAYYNLGDCLEKLGDRVGAVEAHRGALRCKPDYAAAHHHLGDLLARQGRATEAIEHLRHAAQLDPQNAAARKRLAEVEAEVEGATRPASKRAPAPG
jgi:Flp pilus assembly protein TadD